MTTFFFALKTYKRLGTMATMVIAVGIFFLAVCLNAFVAISIEKSNDFQIEVTDDELTQEVLNKVNEIDGVVKSTLVIEFPTTIQVGDSSLSTNIYAVDSSYIDGEFSIGNKFEKGMAMPYLVINHTAAKSFVDKNGIYVDSDKINWVQSPLKIVLEDKKEITAKISGILQADKLELEKEQTDETATSNSSDTVGEETDKTVINNKVGQTTSAQKKSNNTKEKTVNTSKKNEVTEKKTKAVQKTDSKNKEPNKNNKVPLGNETLPPDDDAIVGSESVSNVDGSKVYMDIETVNKILPSRQNEYSKIFIKVKNFGSQKKVAEQLEKIQLTAVNTDMEIIKEWDVKTSLAITFGLAGLAFMFAGLILICKNSERDLILNRNNYKGLLYFGTSDKEICKMLLERSGIVMTLSLSLGIVFKAILPYFLFTKYKMTSIYAYQMSWYTIFILILLTLVIIAFLYCYFKKKVKAFLY